jgi:L-fucose mutarotase
MKVMMEMGHGDSLVLGDANFPAASNARRLVRADGHSACTVLEAIMQFFPLDTYTDSPAMVMAVVPGDDVETPIWQDYAEILSNAEGRPVELTAVPRQDFYDLAREAYAVVATGETALYANLLLVKGVVG